MQKSTVLCSFSWTPVDAVTPCRGPACGSLLCIEVLIGLSRIQTAFSG